MQLPSWKAIADQVPARHEWTERNEAVVRTLMIRGQAFSLAECETTNLPAWKVVSLTGKTGCGDEGAFSRIAMPVATEKPRRKMGNDVIRIAADFNAPLSPEEEELFGL